MNYITNNSNDELIHYGVLGMKWGIRRANSASKKATKAKKAGNKQAYQKYLDKYQRITKRHTSRSTDAAYELVKRMSSGKVFVETMLYGSYGALKYNEYRGKNYHKAAAYVGAMNASRTNFYTLGLQSVIGPQRRMYGEKTPLSDFNDRKTEKLNNRIIMDKKYY